MRATFPVISHRQRLRRSGKEEVTSHKPRGPSTEHTHPSDPKTPLPSTTNVLLYFTSIRDRLTQGLALEEQFGGAHQPRCACGTSQECYTHTHAAGGSAADPAAWLQNCHLLRSLCDACPESTAQPHPPGGAFSVQSGGTPIKLAPNTSRRARSLWRTPRAPLRAFPSCKTGVVCHVRPRA